MSCIDVIPWPALIFGVIILLIIIGIIFVADLNHGLRIWIFLAVLILGIIWLLIICLFCFVNYHIFGWFLLILPIALFLSMMVAYWLAVKTTCSDCVIGDWVFIDFIPHNKYVPRSI